MGGPTIDWLDRHVCLSVCLVTRNTAAQHIENGIDNPRATLQFSHGTTQLSIKTLLVRISMSKHGTAIWFDKSSAVLWDMVEVETTVNVSLTDDQTSPQACREYRHTPSLPLTDL